MIEYLGIYFNRSDMLFFSDLALFFGETNLKIIRFKMDGYKNIEIADKLGCCPATITKHMAEIKATIKEKIRNGSL